MNRVLSFLAVFVVSALLTGPTSTQKRCPRSYQHDAMVGTPTTWVKTGCAVAVTVAVFLFLRYRPAAPRRTRLPELLALIENLQQASEREATAYRPTAPARVDDLSTSALELLRQLPGVDKVEVPVAVARPTQRIVHVLDDHQIPEDLHGSDAEQEERYQEFLLEAAIVQVQRLALLRTLAQHHGMKTVFVEGLTAAGLVEYADQRQQFLDILLLGYHGESKDLLLTQGVSARLPGVSVLPLDSVRWQPENESAKRCREEVMVKNVLANGTFGLIVLDGGHDLSKLVPPRCEYVRVWVRHFPE